MSPQDAAPMSNSPRKEPIEVEAIQSWLVSQLSQLLEIDPTTIDLTTSFDSYGLESSTAIGLSGDLEDWLGFEVDPTVLYDYPTIEALSEHLVSLASE